MKSDIRFPSLGGFFRALTHPTYDIILCCRLTVGVNPQFSRGFSLKGIFFITLKLFLILDPSRAKKCSPVLGGKPVKFQVVCPQNGTASAKRVHSVLFTGDHNKYGVGPTRYGTRKKNCIFTHQYFYQQYLVLFTMVPP